MRQPSCSGWIIPFGSIADAWPIIANLLAGSLVGAWVGAGVATRLDSKTLRRVIAVMLVGIACILLFAHSPSLSVVSTPIGVAQAIAGVVLGFLIGIVASILGVAGGELLIPTLVLLFDVDIRLAGSLSLAVSLPTMLTAFTRYSRSQSFLVIGKTADLYSQWSWVPSRALSLEQNCWGSFPSQFYYRPLLRFSSFLQ